MFKLLGLLEIYRRYFAVAYGERSPHALPVLIFVVASVIKLNRNHRFAAHNLTIPGRSIVTVIVACLSVLVGVLLQEAAYFGWRSLYSVVNFCPDDILYPYSIYWKYGDNFSYCLIGSSEVSLLFTTMVVNVYLLDSLGFMPGRLISSACKKSGRLVRQTAAATWQKIRQIFNPVVRQVQQGAGDAVDAVRNGKDIAITFFGQLIMLAYFTAQAIRHTLMGAYIRVHNLIVEFIGQQLGMNGNAGGNPMQHAAGPGEDVAVGAGADVAFGAGADVAAAH